MSTNDDCQIIVSQCMHCYDVYGCFIKSGGIKKNRRCDTCDDQTTCVWRDLGTMQLLPQDITISHGYCTIKCTLLSGNNADIYTIDEIVDLISMQPGFSGSADALRRRLESAVFRAQQKNMQSVQIIAIKKALIACMS